MPRRNIGFGYRKRQTNNNRITLFLPRSAMILVRLTQQEQSLKLRLFAWKQIHKELSLGVEDRERGPFKTGGNSEGLPQIIVWAHKY